MCYPQKVTGPETGHFTIAAPRSLLSRLTARNGSLRPHEQECFSLYASTSFTDKTLECADCGQQFNHSAQDQQFYAERQFSEPRRCPTCRAVRKAARGDSGGSYSGGGYAGSSSGYGQREMFTATCDSCGGQARVPFKPTGSKPVYCSDCFSTRR